MTSGAVPFCDLIERTNDADEVVLSGWLGRAEIIGHQVGVTENGNTRWSLFLFEPDERAKERRRLAKQRRRERQADHV